jgi:hypothetical protein
VESSEVSAVFFFHEKKVAVIPFGIDRDSFLERMRAGDCIPLPRSAIPLRVTHVRIESGVAPLYVMTVDHLTAADGKLHDFCFAPLR